VAALLVCNFLRCAKDAIMRNIIDGNLPTTASTPSARVISYQRVQISYSCVSRASDLDLRSAFYTHKLTHTHTHTHTPHFLTRTLTKQTLSLNVQHKRDRSTILIPTFPLLFTYFYCLQTVITHLNLLPFILSSQKFGTYGLISFVIRQILDLSTAVII